MTSAIIFKVEVVALWLKSGGKLSNDFSVQLHKLSSSMSSFVYLQALNSRVRRS